MVCWQPKIEHRCIIHAENFVAEIFLFDRKFSKILTATVWYWNNQRKLYEVEWQIFFYIGVLTEKESKDEIMAWWQPKIDHHCITFCCRNFSFWQETFRNTARYIMVLEYSKKIVWRRVAEIFLEVGILTENQSKDEIVWLQNGIIFT